jgi:hypothetical protein
MRNNWEMKTLKDKVTVGLMNKSDGFPIGLQNWSLHDSLLNSSVAVQLKLSKVSNNVLNTQSISDLHSGLIKYTLVHVITPRRNHFYGTLCLTNFGRIVTTYPIANSANNKFSPKVLLTNSRVGE